ncbi:hypothetical protein ACK1W8_002141 [Salmonella enterica]|nr:hypothetical protein [Salmonella enterica subsp. enterica serovar Sandiego]
MISNNENILSDDIKLLLSSYFIYKEDNPYFKKAIDDYLLSLFDDDNFTPDIFYLMVDSIWKYIQEEVRNIVNEILKRVDDLDIHKANREDVFKKIELEIRLTRLDVDECIIESLTSNYLLGYFSTDAYKHIAHEGAQSSPLINTIALAILYKNYASYSSYLSNFLSEMIFESGYKFNSDIFNKKVDSKKGKRGPIKKNIETEKLVSAITSATVEKYPNASDHKLTQAIQEYLSSKKIDNSYNTIKKWVKERREQEGTTCNGEESYKGPISLIIP